MLISVKWKLFFHVSLSIYSAKKEYVENAVKNAFETQSPAPYSSSSSKANTDFLDRQLFEKADLDYIPGLDYDLGPVFIPSKDQLSCFSLLFEIITFCLIAPLDKLPGLDENAAAAKARADEEARKKAEAAAAEADAKKKEQATSSVKPILPHSSMFIFSSTNP